MYSSYPSTSSPYTSPPPPNDPYRHSPVSLPSKQPYAFSPPPVPPNPQVGYMRPPQNNYAYNGQSRSPYPQQSASRYQQSSSSGYRSGGSSGVPAQPSQLPPAKHKGTLAPGQMVQVGDHSVRIEKYLSEGGYAHVYLTTSDKPIYPPTKGEKRGGRWGEIGYTQHCLKRIAFQDESVWADVRKEIEVMKALPPNPHLTQYLGSAHTKLPRGGYEVYILMEFCSGGGIIDLLNKRLRDRLKEIEILNIFTDVCEAVAAMHALKRPLLHRDLKIENVLSSPSGQPPSPGRPTPLTFKLCDFGSTTYPATSPPSSKLESDTLALDLNKHTTLQYRSPEMVEPMLGLPVGLPSDVWALGVLLYKLCYYTTPFEEHGTLAIVNAKYTFPQFPVYSPRLQHLIASMLLEQPVRRPTIFEVLKQAHEMSGTRPEIDYPTPSRSISSSQSQRQPQQRQSQPSSSHTSKQGSVNLLDFTSPSSSIDRSPSMQPSIPTVQPQRRGRPTPARGPSHTSQPPMPVPPSIPQVQAPTPVSASTTAPKLQVTGEKQASPKKTGSVDAFGMPSMSSATRKQGSGFGDSFGFAQDGGVRKPQPQPGFSDSFGGKKSTSPKKSGLQQSLRPSDSTQNSFSTFDIPRIMSPAAVSTARKSPDPSSSIPNGEVSFESRFPSIETLSSGDAPSPPLSNSTSRPSSTTPNLISPIVSPPTTRRNPSVMGNLTGGNMTTNHLSAPGLGGPQPRSTHVTGTAFKGIQGGLLSPDPVAPIATNSSLASSTGKKDYFEGIEAQPLVSPSASAMSGTSPGRAAPRDLMTGDNEDMSGGLLRPTLSASSSSIGPSLPRPPSAASAAQAPPMTGHNRPLLPHINSQKPTSNIDSESWSPLERLKSSQSQKAPAVERKQSESSSDEEVPENVNATNRRPSSPKRQGSASGTSGITKRMSAFDMDKDNGASNKPFPSFSKPTSEGLRSSGSQRPMSMYNLSSSTSVPRSSGELSPPPSAGLSASTSNSFAKPTERPQHVRKGSINDIVSKYESLTSPVYPSSGGGEKAKKPSVAAKPAGLRKSTVEEASKKSESVAAKSIRAPEKPVKPAKPDLIKPIAVRHGEAPQATGWSKSSSGRSFPTSSHAVPTLSTSTSNKPLQDEGRTSPRKQSVPISGVGIPENGKMDASGKSSPEKQQAVNLLIQRWNKGDVGEKKVVERKGGYI